MRYGRAKNTRHGRLGRLYSVRPEDDFSFTQHAPIQWKGREKLGVRDEGGEKKGGEI
jgi:hypothetical protein